MVVGTGMQPHHQYKLDAAECSVDGCCEIQQSIQQMSEDAEGDDDDKKHINSSDDGVGC